MKNCKDCGYWTRVSEEGERRRLGKHAGHCSSDKFIYREYEKVPQDGLSYWDYEGYSAGFETGENFGCVHFKRREPQPREESK